MIRDATEADMGDLLRMAKSFHYAARLREFALFEDSINGWQQWFTQCIESPHVLCAVAEKDGEAAGFITAVVHGAYWNPDVKVCAEMAMWVEPSARGNGVGSGLVKAARDFGDKHGCVGSAVGAHKNLHPKQTGRLYRELGYEKAEQIYFRRSKCRG